MLSNPAMTARKSHSLYQFHRLSWQTPSAFNVAATIPVSPLRSCSHLRSCHQSVSLVSSSNGVKELACKSQFSIAKLGSYRFRAFSVSDGGSGGDSGGSGNSGGGNSGSGGSGNSGGGKDWSLLSWYLALLEKYPVLTKAITSSILTLIGDVICQLAIDKAPSLDLRRTFLFTSLGLVLVGPTLHHWYLYLSKLVKLPGFSGVVVRLLLDQFLFSPLFIGVFLSTLVTLEGRPHQVIPKLQQEWFSAVLANWQLWIPFQFLNFRFVPQQFQLDTMILPRKVLPVTLGQHRLLESLATIFSLCIFF